MAGSTGTIETVLPTGWAGDIFYTVVRADGPPVVVDAYQAGSGLLMPGQEVVLPEPEQNIPRANG